MIVKTGEIYKLKEKWSDTGCEYAKVSFPTDPEGNDFCIVDCIPCDKDGNEAEGYEVGVPMSTDLFDYLESGV
jgi:hypothetical protein